VKLTPPRLPAAVLPLAEFHAAKTVLAEAREPAKARKRVKQEMDLRRFNPRKITSKG
jgi:hypothetical protein